MLVKILKPFQYAEDGIVSRLLRPSEDPDHREEVRDDLCGGLSGEGYIDGAPHGLPLLSEKRRADLIERILATGRAEFARFSDADLISAVERYEAHAKALAEETHAAEADEDDEEHEDDTLLGSSTLPAHVQIGDVTVVLGGLVVAAARMSNHDTASWNALSEPDRDALLQKAIDVLASDPALLAEVIDPSAIVPKAPETEAQDGETRTNTDPPEAAGAPGPAEGAPAVETVAEPAPVIEGAAETVTEPAAAEPAPAAKSKAKKATKPAAKD